MNATPRLKTLVPAVVFVVAATLTYLGVTHRPKVDRKTTEANDTIAGIDGLVEGDIITLPQMKTLKGEPAALESVATEKILFVFFTPSCVGCSLDAELWKSLKEESAQRRIALYLIDVGHDRAALDKFVEAYELGRLSILVSEGPSVGKMLKVNIVPQYLLIEKTGKVLHRWDGVQHNKQPLFANVKTD